MSGFSPDWLHLREPFDAAARPTALVDELLLHVTRGTTEKPLEIVDLGAGAGSNLRYLAPQLCGVQRWRLIDHDRPLLQAALKTTHGWATARGADVRKRWRELTMMAPDFECLVQCERCDLAGHPVTLPLADIALPKGVLVTAAALLDLVSREWLDLLAARCLDARATVCLALSYDGRTTCTPAEPEDAEVLELFNRHQLGDKGFGAALGPGAATAAQKAFNTRGYQTKTLPSDWQIGPQYRAMQRALLDGWLGAARELAPKRHAALDAWHRRRCEHVAAGRSQLRVGHVDLIGWL